MLCQTPHADNAEEKQIKAVRRKKRAAESQGEATDGDGNIASGASPKPKKSRTSACKHSANTGLAANAAPEDEEASSSTSSRATAAEPGGAVMKRGGEQTHCCKEDDTCVKVASLYGVDPEMVVLKNKLMKQVRKHRHLRVLLLGALGLLA